MSYAGIIVGIVGSIVGAGVNAGMASQASDRQAAIINRQRLQAQDARAMAERRQAWLAKQMEQDDAMRQKGVETVNKTMEGQSAEATKAGLKAETQRLSDVLTPDNAKGVIANEMSTATNSNGVGNVGGNVLIDDRASKADMFGKNAQMQLGALAKNMAYDTFGQKQAISLARGADQLGFIQNLRKGNRDAYERQMRTLMSGEDAANAATNSLSNYQIPLDTRIGDTISGLGGVALQYGMGQAGQRQATTGKGIFDF
jgi:hypothetical protein